MIHVSRLTAVVALALAASLAACEAGAQVTPRTASSGEVTIAVDPSRFLAKALVSKVTTEMTTLSDGTRALCYVITTKPLAPDHRMGPWCPRHISDSASAGGIWPEGGHVHDVDGAFVEHLAEFYADSTWLMYDENGDIHVTDSKEACAGAARPDVGEEYRNHCVQCLPSYIDGITTTVRLPVTPVRLEQPDRFGRGPAGPRGVALNGIVFDAPAPTDAILSAHALAPFDDAGGHINLHVGYHYHAATGASTSIAQTDGHAPMIGYAMDGYAIFAHLDAHGDAPTGLDECGGHVDDVRGYHYHAADPGSNSFIQCFRGAQVPTRTPPPDRGDGGEHPRHQGR